MKCIKWFLASNLCTSLNIVGSRLISSVIKSKFVPGDIIDCLIECATEPCCRSINYKNDWIFENETNCEMMHNIVYNTSKETLEKNSSYDYAYLINPTKVRLIVKHRQGDKDIVIIGHSFYDCRNRKFVRTERSCLS